MVSFHVDRVMIVTEKAPIFLPVYVVGPCEA